MILHPIPSEFPYIWGKLTFFFISAYSLAGLYDNPMPELTLSSQSGGSMNSATGLLQLRLWQSDALTTWLDLIHTGCLLSGAYQCYAKLRRRINKTTTALKSSTFIGYCYVAIAISFLPGMSNCLFTWKPDVCKQYAECWSAACCWWSYPRAHSPPRHWSSANRFPWVKR